MRPPCSRCFPSTALFFAAKLVDISNSSCRFDIERPLEPAAVETLRTQASLAYRRNQRKLLLGALCLAVSCTALLLVLWSNASRLGFGAVFGVSAFLSAAYLWTWVRGEKGCLQAIHLLGAMSVQSDVALGQHVLESPVCQTYLRAVSQQGRLLLRLEVEGLWQHLEQ